MTVCEFCNELCVAGLGPSCKDCEEWWQEFNKEMRDNGDEHNWAESQEQEMKGGG